MSEWSKVCLGELIKVKHGFAFPGQFITSEMTDRILVTPGNFCIGGGFKQGKFKYFSSHDYPAEYQFLGGELIVTMTDLSKETDTLGYSAVVPSDGKVYLHNQRVGLIEPISAQSCLEFVYWLMRWRDYQEFIVNSASGTSVMHTSPSRICEFEFELPPLPEQKAIASVLSSLDDKIDLLHRQNKTLEAMAETLFRQWFIEEAKEDWPVKPLKEICQIINGFAFKSGSYTDSGYKVIRTLNFTNHKLDTNQLVYVSEGTAKEYGKYNLQRKDFLLVMVGASLGNYAIVTKDALPALQNQNMWCFRAFDDCYQNFLNHRLLDVIEENLSGASGSAREFFQKSVFYEISVALPPSELIEMYNLQVDPLFNKMESNREQIQTLEKLRDTLLPKLMSGEVRVQY